jgi:hypothetical protein
MISPLQGVVTDDAPSSSLAQLTPGDEGLEITVGLPCDNEMEPSLLPTEASPRQDEWC